MDFTPDSQLIGGGGGTNAQGLEKPPKLQMNYHTTLLLACCIVYGVRGGYIIPRIDRR